MFSFWLHLGTGTLCYKHVFVSSSVAAVSCNAGQVCSFPVRWVTLPWVCSNFIQETEQIMLQIWKSLAWEQVLLLAFPSVLCLQRENKPHALQLGVLLGHCKEERQYQASESQSVCSGSVLGLRGQVWALSSCFDRCCLHNILFLSCGPSVFLDESLHFSARVVNIVTLYLNRNMLHWIVK